MGKPKVDAYRLLRNLAAAREYVEGRLHAVAWRTVQPKPWDSIGGFAGGTHSDPTYAAIEALEKDLLYQSCRKVVKFIDKLPPAQRQVAEAIAAGRVSRKEAEAFHQDLLKAVEALFKEESEDGTCAEGYRVGVASL